MFCLSTVLTMLLAIGGCGASADAPTPVVSDAERAKKKQEYEDRMKKGMQSKDETVKKPGGG
jgi:hypothetical protein